VSTESSQLLVRNNPEALRYELVADGEVVGRIDYRRSHDAVVLVHTEIVPAFKGQGLGARLVAGALEDIRAQGLRVVAVCPYVRAYMRKHSESA
jgi:predicted GNAT family acetyltransferase